MRAKIAQERLIKASIVPYTIVRATQFFEFIGRIADGSTEGNTVRLTSALMRPVAADDVAAHSPVSQWVSQSMAWSSWPEPSRSGSTNSSGNS